MGFAHDVLSFEGFNLKGMLKKIGHDPERIFIGAGDPFSSKMWSKITGKDYSPIVDQMGGASNDTYTKARDAGINTGPGKSMQQAAHVIAAAYAGGYGAGAAGAGGAGAAGATGAGAAEGAAGAGAAAGASGSAWTPALIDSSLGTAGYGASSAGAGGGAGVYEGIASGAGSTSGSSWWSRMQDQMGQGNGLPQLGGGQKRTPVKIDTVSDYTPGMPEYDNLIAKYNSGEGNFDDGHSIHVDGGQAYLVNDQGDVVHSMPANGDLYAFLNNMNEG